MRDLWVRARCPLRISFSGGATDIPPYPARHGGIVLSTTIDQFIYASTTFFEGHNSELVQTIIDELDSESGAKIQIETHSEVPPGSGLGSSSAYVVSTIKAIAGLLAVDLPKYRLAELSVKIERQFLKIKGGFQDNFAESFGGFNFLEFNERAVVNPLRLNGGVLDELHASLLLVNTGKTRLSSNIIERQIASYEREDPRVMEILKEMKGLTLRAKSALLRGELKEFGQVINLEWQAKRKLDGQISDPSIDFLVSGGLMNGATAGKVLGAGGGGHLLFMVPLEKRQSVIKFLATKGLQHTPFGFDLEGAVSWRLDGSDVPV
jgi:D-glycero-alpha-D-manno-heptose-7-phosphate kinase